MRATLFKEFGVGLVHGRLAADERDAIMRSFRDGKLGILVATTVIEVGIDIPNATVMVIEHAERFGLVATASVARPGRARHGRQGWCLLVNRAPQSSLAGERLAVWKKNTMVSRSPKPTCGCAVPANCLARASRALPIFAWRAWRAILVS